MYKFHLLFGGFGKLRIPQGGGGDDFGIWVRSVCAEASGVCLGGFGAGLGRAGGTGDRRDEWSADCVVADPDTEKTADFRRITIKLDKPTRDDDDDELHLLSNVPIEDAAAVVLAELYRKRWTIENVFQEITQTLQCEIATLGYPKAALFAFCLALLAFNAVSVLKASLRTVHSEETVQQTVSGYYLSLEIRSTYDGMMIAISEEHWTVFRTLTTRKFATLLKQIARHVNLSRYRKHPRGPKKKPPKKTTYKDGGHVSTHKLLQQRK